MKTLSTPWRLMLAIGCIDLLFVVPVVMAYYQLKGVDLGAFLVLQGLFRVAVVVLEIPTGYLADRWSRTAQLTVGALLWLLGQVGVLLANGFGGLLVAELFMAASVAFYSGTTQAYLHEALHHEGRDHEQATWQGRLFASSTGAEMLAGALGGWLFGWWVDAPVIGCMIAATVALYVTAKLPPLPKHEVSRRHHNPLMDIWLVTHHSLRRHPRLPWLLLGPKVILGYTGLLFWVMQSKLLALQVSPTNLGLGFAAYMGIKTCVGLQAGRIAKLGEAKVMLAMPWLLVVGCGLLLTGNPWLVWLGGVCSAGFIHAVMGPLSVTLINREMPNHERATVLSVGSMIGQLMGAMLMMLSAPLLNLMSLNGLVIAYLVLVLALSGYPLWRLRQT